MILSEINDILEKSNLDLTGCVSKKSVIQEEFYKSRYVIRIM